MDGGRSAVLCLLHMIDTTSEMEYEVLRDLAGLVEMAIVVVVVRSCGVVVPHPLEHLQH